jgi:hypothetical protein
MHLNSEVADRPWHTSPWCIRRGFRDARKPREWEKAIDRRQPANKGPCPFAADHGDLGVGVAATDGPQGWSRTEQVAEVERLEDANA